MHFPINRKKTASGFVMAEAMIAIALLSAALLPLSYAFNHERQLVKASYDQAIAMELVDGEMELLQAGEWRSFPEGSQNYTAHGVAVTNLPPGQFILFRNSATLRLEWIPAKRGKGGRVMREAKLK